MTDVTEVVEPTPEEEPQEQEAQPQEPEAPPPAPDIDKELARRSRRGFLVFGAGSIAAYVGWKLLSTANRIGDVPWPLRRGFETNEKLSEAYFKESRLSPTFPPSARTYPRINGGVGLHA